jgi:AraC-like DNA-binding protein
MLRQTMERIDRLLDSQTSESEIDRQLANARFLRECKTKGFKELRRQGLIKQATDPAYERREELARETAYLVNDRLLSINTIARRLRATPKTLESYCKEFGFTLKSSEERKAEAKLRRDKKAADAKLRREERVAEVKRRKSEQAALAKKEIADREKAIFKKVKKLIKNKSMGDTIKEVGVSKQIIDRIFLERGYKLNHRKLTKVNK